MEALVSDLGIHKLPLQLPKTFRIEEKGGCLASNKERNHGIEIEEVRAVFSFLDLTVEEDIESLKEVM